MSLVNFRNRSVATLGYLLTNLCRGGAHLLAPATCCLCQGSGQPGRGLWGLDLCEHCAAACPPVPDACPRCASRLAPGGACAGCTVYPPPFDATFACAAYEHPIDYLVRELKFRNALPHARVLGMLLAQRRRAAPAALPDCVIPIPLHRDRYIERGFNQAEEIARHAARGLGLPLRSRLLQRTRATPEQSGLPATARRQNLHGAFRVTARLGGRHVVHEGDVLTTGSTVAEAARTLKAAGVARVEVWVAARALETVPI